MKRYIAVVLLTLMLAGAAGCTSGVDGVVASVSPTTQSPAPTGDTEDGTTARGAIDVIMSGYSAKTFVEKDVSKEDIEKILQCGVKAPSARNSQPWHFTVVTNPEKVAEYARDAVSGTVAIVVSGMKEPMEGVDEVFDCALATQNMYIAAQSLGLGVHLYASTLTTINENERDYLKIPEGYEALTVLLIGHVEAGTDGVTSASERNELSDVVNYVE